MNLIAAALVLLVCTAAGAAQTGEFNQPWKDEQAALVIDPFQGNDIDEPCERTPLYPPD